MRKMGILGAWIRCRGFVRWRAKNFVAAALNDVEGERLRECRARGPTFRVLR